jgi:hypothetical protein
MYNSKISSFWLTLLYADLFLGFDPENVGDVFLRNVSGISADYKALYTRRQNCS